MTKTKLSRLPWDLGLLCALYIVLPEYFALELSAKLPLITAGRVLLALSFGMLVIRNWACIRDVKRWRLSGLNLGLTQDRFLSYSMLAYFAVLVLVNLTFVPSIFSHAVKELFVLVAEQYLLVWLFVTVLDTRQKLVAALRWVVYGSALVAVAASISCILNENLFHWLKTTSRDMLMSDYFRQGMLRAAAGLGHPVYYGAFCAIMLPLCMYFIETEPQRKQRLVFVGAMVMNLVGLTLSNSRGSILAVGCLMVFVFVLRAFGKKLKTFFKTYIPVFALALVVLVLVTAMTPAGTRYLSSVAESMGDTISSLFPSGSHSQQAGTPGQEGPELEIPDKDQVEFGENPNGVRSRTVQLTGILWTFKHNALTGFGPAAHVREQVRFHIHGNWQIVRSLDIAPVAMICQYGLIGLLGFAFLYLGFFKTYLDKKYRNDPLMHHLFLCFVTYGLCLMSISDLDRAEWVLLAATVSLVNIIRKEAPSLEA